MKKNILPLILILFLVFSVNVIATTEILRPNAPGDECNLPAEVGAACPNHYQNVDEVTSDGDGTYNRAPKDAIWYRDLYNISDSGVGAGLINSVTVYAVARHNRPDATWYGFLRIAIKTGGTVYESSIKDIINTYTSNSQEWVQNPRNAHAWTWAEIDALQIGAKIRGSGTLPCFTHLTQVYVEVDYTPPPDPPTNVQATDGTHTDKVVVTWTKSDGATGYQVYRNGVGLGWLGDVDSYWDYGADAPTITAGTASASDGTSIDHVTLSIAGEGTSNGTTHTYKVRAKNAAGESGDSGTNTGYKGVGALTYQWQRSSGDSDADYSNIDGATTDPYNDTGAPENGDGRYYKCVENATGAAEQTTNADRGYRIAPVAINVIFFSTPY